ncbi:hypothetical protein [Ornithinimicrobium sufpigmenti]|uniref:hypothetical protein n=1 Tax=Ornithinimicrobium sufpigmenti TaxID=2508882 RepID=UPI0010368DD5|nr:MULTISPECIES: hypothetical protein [unclassified Ornithinimicrobium]
MFENSSQEFALGVVAAGLTAVFAALSSLNAQTANTLLGPDGRTRTAVTTAGLAVLAFVAWWGALPGSFATDELELAPFWPSLFVAVVSLCLPLVARALKVEPVPRPV